MKLQLNFIDVPSAIIPGETILNQIISKEKKAIKPINQLIKTRTETCFLALVNAATQLSG